MTKDEWAKMDALQRVSQEAVSALANWDSFLAAMIQKKPYYKYSPLTLRLSQRSREVRDALGAEWKGKE